MTRPTPNLLFLGVSHRNTPLALRERFALPPDRAAALAAALRGDPALAELCLLNTCNRVELYAVTSRLDAAAALAETFCRIQAIEPALLAAHALELRGADAVGHLFAVAAGLDSQMVGEAEILGQVKDAFAAAQSAGHLGPVLNRVFQKAFQAAKLIRSETAIGEGQVSVATVAVALAEKIFGRLRDSRVLIVGAGDIAEKTAKALRSRDAGALTFTNRTAVKAEELAREFSGAALPFAELGAGLPRFDIVVSSTAAPDPIITLPMVYAAMHARASRPLFLIDLALPRDIEPGAAELPNVFLYNLDDLARLAAENVEHRRAELARARGILDQRAAATWGKLASPPA
ncbi:MAG TPA: glutamyl-tRNA reductase [Opitutaceae bacterium]|nr:glutamyl-tRNA reductase [Opitutaceae bacterium]